MIHNSIDTPDETETTYTTSGAARVTGDSESFIRRAADDGRLAYRRTQNGIRIFNHADLIRFQQERKRR
jgi:hypothetical protein